MNPIKLTFTIALAATLLLALPAAAASPSVAFVFGRRGGSIQPFQVMPLLPAVEMMPEQVLALSSQGLE